jgi:hypothetical protein
MLNCGSELSFGIQSLLTLHVYMYMYFFSRVATVRSRLSANSPLP